MHIGLKLSASVICLFAGVLLISHSPLFADSAVVEYDHLNIRSGPGQDHERLGQAMSGDRFFVETVTDDWIKIDFNGQEGWISSEYISIKTDADGKETSTEMDVPVNESVTIKQDKLHLRAGPSTDEPINGFVEEGTTFDIEGENKEWLKITNENQSGYVFKELLGENKQDGYDSLKNKKVVIDAGHGGKDVGAIGVSDTYEKNFTLRTAKALAKEVGYLGADVTTTRSKDNFKSLLSRSALANDTDADIFISLHYNSMPEFPTATGVETYFYHDQNQSLAEFIQQGLVKESNTRDRGVTQENFSVLRQTFKPSVLIELGFMSNPEDEQLFQKELYQQNLVRGIATGMQRYFHQER